MKTTLTLNHKNLECAYSLTAHCHFCENYFNEPTLLVVAPEITITLGKEERIIQPKICKDCITQLAILVKDIPKTR